MLLTDKQIKEMAIGDCVLAKISPNEDHTGDENDDSIND